MSRFSLSRSATLVAILAATLAGPGCILASDFPVLSEESWRVAGSCGNDLDEDLDGLSGCADPDCLGSPECAESTAALCANAFDDDQDGASDCTDPDCSGFCVEGDLVSCTNGWDDDADGMRDGEDVQCWALRPPTLRRCSGAAPVDLAYPFDEPGDDDGLAFAGDGAHAVVTPPGSTSPALYVEGSGGLVTAGTLDELRLAWSGAALDATLVLGVGARVTLGLAPAELVPAGQPLLAGPGSLPLAISVDALEADVMSASATVTLHADGRSASSLVSFGNTYGQPLFPRIPIRIRVDEASGGGVTVQAQVTGPMGVVSLPPLPAPAGTSGNLRLVFLVEGFGFLDEVRLTSRGGASACDRDAPHLPPGGQVGRLDGIVDVGSHLSVARVGEDAAGTLRGPRYCALALGCEAVGAVLRRTLRLYRSDDAMRWTADAVPLARDEGAMAVGPGALAWDEARGAYVGALVTRRVGGFSPAQLETFTVGADCEVASAPERTLIRDEVRAGTDFSCLDATEEVAGISYVVGPAGHELYLDARGDEGVVLELQRSADGVMWGAPEQAFAADARAGLGHPITVSAAGAVDRVVLAPGLPTDRGPSLRAFLLAEGAELGAPGLVPPSGLAASFDRYEIAGGSLLAVGPERFLLYAARGDVSAGAIPQPLAAGVGYLDVEAGQ